MSLREELWDERVRLSCNVLLPIVAGGQHAIMSTETIRILFDSTFNPMDDPISSIARQCRDGLKEDFYAATNSLPQSR